MIAAGLISLATVVEVAELAETALAALIAGVGVMFTFSIAIYGFARYTDLHYAGRSGAALAAGVLGALGLVASVGAVVFGIIVMVQG